MRKIAILLIAMMVIGVGFLSGCVESDEGTAYEKAKEYILETLKAPATAKFPSIEETTISKKTENSWIVITYVDAQNLYGALVRQWYACELVNSGETWNLIYINAGDRYSDVSFKWSQVAKFLKSDGEKPDSFQIDGNKIKIEWNTGAKEPSSSPYSSPSFFAVLKKHDTNTQAGSSITLLGSWDSFDSGERIINAEPGIYYFEITSTGLSGYGIQVYDSISLI